ncbi:ChbG/HpnK family deacetylase [Vibrio sp. TRT 21S02]|uniref:ChbG/HpnK family deacetylase n=1 Tax=unclassified Vibrio TaxID=2614977 RepID=UPI00349F495E
MKLIINADDFGLTKSVNKAIVEAMTHGVVSSTTLMVNQSGTLDAVDLIATHQLKGVGLHVNLTLGKPVSDPSDIPTLVDDSGHFHCRQYLLDNAERVNSEHVFLEAMNQYTKAIELGVAVDHVDSHHFSAFLPNVREGFIKFVNAINLPTRRADYYVRDLSLLKVKTTDRFSAEFFDEKATLHDLKQIISESKNEGGMEVLEVMAHPGYSDASLAALSSYTERREQELEILLSGALKDWLYREQIELINFEGLQQ